MTNSPVSWWISQLSEVVTTPSRVTLRRSHASFGAEKYGSSTSPVRWAKVSLCTASSAQMLSARRSCHTIMFDSGLPVSGSQASTVSPWLAMVTTSIGTPALETAARPAPTTEASSSWGSCSTPPPGR